MSLMIERACKMAAKFKMLVYACTFLFQTLLLVVCCAARMLAGIAAAGARAGMVILACR